MLILRTTVIAILAVAALQGVTARAQDMLSGAANIIDGDTLEIADLPVRLEGIDAPEQRQTCVGDGGSEVACGTRATKALARLIGGSPVSCTIQGRDGYGRLLADCRSNGESLNAQMVREGWALAFVKYSGRFAGEEEQARLERLGLWQWRFDKPWDWRAGVLQQAVETASERPGECLIKGNISRGGERIYHMPFHQHYGRTRISSSQGERWFCTEDEALAAGWRRALR